jgi:hypothetical protein
MELPKRVTTASHFRTNTTKISHLYLMRHMVRKPQCPHIPPLAQANNRSNMLQWRSRCIKARSPAKRPLTAFRVRNLDTLCIPPRLRGSLLRILPPCRHQQAALPGNTTFLQSTRACLRLNGSRPVPRKSHLLLRHTVPFFRALRNYLRPNARPRLQFLQTGD